jgi:hypothetical protein
MRLVFVVLFLGTGEMCVSVCACTHTNLCVCMHISILPYWGNSMGCSKKNPSLKHATTCRSLSHPHHGHNYLINPPYQIASPKVNSCPIRTGQVAKSIYRPWRTRLSPANRRRRVAAPSKSTTERKVLRFCSSATPRPNRLSQSQFLSVLDLVSDKIYLPSLTNALGTCGSPSSRRRLLEIDHRTKSTSILSSAPPGPNRPPRSQFLSDFKGESSEIHLSYARKKRLNSYAQNSQQSISEKIKLSSVWCLSGVCLVSVCV